MCSLVCGSSLCSPLLCLPSYLLLCRRSGGRLFSGFFSWRRALLALQFAQGHCVMRTKLLSSGSAIPPLTPLHPHTLHPLASRPPHRMRLRHVACRRSSLTVNQQIARAAPSALLRAKCCDASCIPSAWFGYLWTTAGKYKYAYVYGFSGDLW